MPALLDVLAAPTSSLTYLALLAPAFVVSPGLLQKIFGARDDRAVRLGVGLNALGLLRLRRRPGAARHHRPRRSFPTSRRPNLALPMILMHVLPPLVGAIGAGGGVLGGGQRRRRVALHADDVAVAGSLQALPATRRRATTRVLRGRTVADARQRRARRRCWRWSSEDVIATLTIFYTLLGVSLFVPIVGGLYVPRTTNARRAGVDRRRRRRHARRAARDGRRRMGRRDARAGRVSSRRLPAWAISLVYADAGSLIDATRDSRRSDTRVYEVPGIRSADMTQHDVQDRHHRRRRHRQGSDSRRARRHRGGDEGHRHLARRSPSSPGAATTT